MSGLGSFLSVVNTDWNWPFWLFAMGKIVVGN